MRSAKQNLAADVAALKGQLSEVLATLAMLAKAASEHQAGSYTLKQFLARNSLSESQYHKLRRAGLGPRVMKTGSVGVRISRQAELDWITAREAEAETAKENAPRERPSDSSNDPFAAGRNLVQSKCVLPPIAP
jgi:hypothetical protein